LDNHLGTPAPFNVGGCLPTHASIAYATRAQQLQNRRASAAHPLKTLGGQHGNGEAQGTVPARSLRHKTNLLDVSWDAFCH